MAWRTSDRAARLPSDWAVIKRQVRQRAGGRCQAQRHDPHCNGVGAEADHIHPGDDHSLDNLQWLSAECHKAKTRRETIARNRLNAKLKRRPTEAHPGRIDND